MWEKDLLVKDFSIWTAESFGSLICFREHILSHILGCYDSGSDFSGRLLTGYDYGTPQASSRISHGQSSQSAG